MNFDFADIDVCVYHKDCCDGFTAAWLIYCFNRANNNKDIKYIPATYNMNTDEVLTDVRDKNVLIVDFSYKRDVLELMKSTAKSLLVLDHHKTAQKELEGLDYAIFDINECGASLLHKHLFPLMELPTLVAYVKDRDLWSKTLKHTRDINSVIQTTEKSFASWDYLYLTITNNFYKCVTTGKIINNSTDFHTIETAKNSKLVEMNIPNNRPIKMRVINIGIPGFISDTLNSILELYDDVDVSCSYTVFPDGGQLFSLRSRPSFDCSFIATAYGGGGHAQSCAFKIKDVVGFPWKVLNDDRFQG